MDAVTEVLLDRSHERDAVTRMVALSLGVHVLLLGGLAVIPHTSNEEMQPIVIQIAGASAPGPVQGHTPTSAKPVQQAVPDTAKPKADIPPALPTPKMIEPIKTAKPEVKTPPKPDLKKLETQLHSRTPTTGAEVKAGQARVDTKGDAIPFGSFATGGGHPGAAYTDVANFCCPDYLELVTGQIRANWQAHQPQVGSNIVTFTILRDGSVRNVILEKSSGAPLLDLVSQRAVAATSRVPPLPSAFTPDHLTLHLGFEYER